jgi:hypothetical protein
MPEGIQNHHSKSRRKQKFLFVKDHLDHLTYHILSSVEIGYHAVFERADRLYVFVSLLVHLHSPLAYCDDFICAAVYSYDRWLVYYDLIVMDESAY